MIKLEVLRDLYESDTNMEVPVLEIALQNWKCQSLTGLQTYNELKKLQKQKC